MKWSLTILAALGAASPSWGAQAKPPQETPEEREASREYLRGLSLQDLMNLTVTTPARQEQPLFGVPAAVSVIRGDDLRRMGVRSLPEALRLVPGIQVARLDGSRWAVTARGFNDFASNKLQVLMDGRSLYTHTFSGIVWQRQDTMLEEIDRIEVIRGPGGATWGSNAVNGVINIITRKASDSQGGLVSAGAGAESRDFAAARWGGKAGEDLHVRVFAKYFNQDEQFEGQDDWLHRRAGLRVDWTPAPGDTVSLIAEAFSNESGGETRFALPAAPFSTLVADDSESVGGFVSLRAQRRFSPESSLEVELTYDGTDGKHVLLDEFREEIQVGFTHRFRPFAAHDFSWGAAYRLFRSEMGNTLQIVFDPEDETEGFPSVFLQDQIELVEGALYATLGSKFEYNDVTGLEVQPTVRLAWTPDADHTFWAAASRAVRTPSQADQDTRNNLLVFPGAPPTWVATFGNPDFRSEEVLALELGYRTRPADALSLDLAVFYNFYDKLLSNEPAPGFLEATPPPAHFVVVSMKENKLEGVSYGAEAAIEWRPLEDWRLRGSYAFTRLNLQRTDGGVDAVTEERLEGSTPRSQASIWSSVDLFREIRLDGIVRYVAGLPAQDADAYVEVDARLAWRPLPNLELSVVGQNLMRSHHEEFGGPPVGFIRTEVERGAYVMVTWKF